MQYTLNNNRVHLYTTSQGHMRSGTFINYLVWESTKKYKDAYRVDGSPEAKSNLLECPVSAVSSPHLFKKVALTDICVG